VILREDNSEGGTSHQGKGTGWKKGRDARHGGHMKLNIASLTGNHSLTCPAKHRTETQKGRHENRRRHCSLGVLQVSYYSEREEQHLNYGWTSKP